MKKIMPSQTRLMVKKTIDGEILNFYRADTPSVETGKVLQDNGEMKALPLPSPRRVGELQRNATTIEPFVKQHSKAASDIRQSPLSPRRGVSSPKKEG